jgi:hypothetical protein
MPRLRMRSDDLHQAAAAAKAQRLAGGADAGVLLRLLARSARPLLAAADAWVAEGRLPASHDEFFVAAGAPAAGGSCPGALRRPPT